MSKEKLCPLFTAASISDGCTGYPYKVCLKEECAWYIRKRCAVYMIAVKA